MRLTKLKTRLSFSICILFAISCITSGFSAVVTSTGTGGNWNAGTSWTGGIVPSSTDTAVVASGATLTVSGTILIGRVVFAVGNVLSAKLNLEDGSNFTISGLLLLNQTIADSTNNTFNVGNATATVSGIIYVASLNDSRKAIVNIGSGTLNINGTLNFNGTNSPMRRGLILGAGATVNLNGTVAGTGGTAFDPTSNFNYLTTGNQNMINTTYGNLGVQGGGVKTLSSSTVAGDLVLSNTNIRLTGNLTLQGNLSLNGVIEQNGRDIILGNGTNITGVFGLTAHISQVNGGKIIKQSNSTLGFLGTFPIGTSLGYTPFTITSLEATLGGANNSRIIEISTFALKHPLATNVGNSLNSFWRLRTINVNSITSFAATANYTDAAIPAGVNEADFNTVARLTSSGWLSNPTGITVDITNNQFVFSALNNVINGDYAIGQATAFSVVDEEFTIQDGSWGTASTWANNAVPSSVANAIVLHRINADPLNGINFVTVATSGVLIYASNNTTINGDLDVFGKWFDTHSGGLNIIGGKTTLHPGSEAIFTGSGGNNLTTQFRGDVVLNSPFVTPGQIQFTSVNNPKITVSGSSSITAGGVIWCNADSLLLNNTGGVLNNDSLRIGSNTGTSNSVLWNNTRLTIGNQIIGRPSGNLVRKLVQGAAGHLVIRNANPVFPNSTGVLEASREGNTVEYAADASLSITNTDYHHLTLTGDRFDRFKTLVGGRDLTIGGNLTVNNNGAVFQCGSGMNGRTIRINGNLILEGNGRIAINGAGTKVNLIIDGKVINNHDANLDFRLNDSTYYNTTFTGTGEISTGTGGFNFRHLKIAGSDTVRWNSSGTTNIFDSLSLGSSAFYAPRSLFFIPLSRTVRFTGSSTTNKIAKLQLTDRADRGVQFFQQIPLEIDSALLLSSSSANQPAFYNFAGQTLIVNRNFAIATNGQNGANSLLRPDTNSTLIIRGNGTVGNLSFFNGFRDIGTLEIDRPDATTTLASGSGVRVFREFKLTNGNLTTNGRIGMHPMSTVLRKKGKMLGNFQNTTGKYMVVYTDSVTTGNEATGLPSITSIKVAAGAGTVVAFGNSPTVDSSFIVESGQMVALQNNYVRLGAAATAQVDRVIPTTFFPVGTTSGRGFFELTVNSDPAGVLTVKPINAPHPRRASALSYLRKYVTLGGTATSRNVDLSVLYDDADVFGVEGNLATSFYSGTTWSTANGTIDIALNKATMTGITAFGDLTAGANMGDTTVSTASRIIQSGIEVYPNPGHAGLFIQSSDDQLNGSRLFISDLTGKIVHSATLVNAKNSISTSTLQAGVYHIKVLDSKGKALLQSPWMKH